MAGTTPTFSYSKLNNATDLFSTYKANIDGNSVAALRIAADFNPHAQSSPNMTIMVDAGHIFDGVTLTEVAAQNTGTITAPVSNSRIDRVVADRLTGTISVVTGTPAVSPTAPAITAGKVPIAQILLTSATATIGNSIITDERDLGQLGFALPQGLNYAADTGAANAYAIAPTPALAAYFTGVRVFLKPANANTTSSTLAVNGLATKNIKLLDGTNPVANQMVTTGIYELVYDGTNFVLLNPSPIPIQLPIGSLYLNSSDNTNPATLLGYGTWAAFGQGRMLIGVGTGTDVNGQTLVAAAGATAGEYKHTQTTAELVSHSHDGSGLSTSSDGTHTHTVTTSNLVAVGSVMVASTQGGSSSSWTSSGAGAHTHTISGTTGLTGSGTAFNVTNPYIVVYIWNRTA